MVTMFKLVVKEQNNQKVLLGFVPEQAFSVNGAELLDVIVIHQACPEPPKEVRDLIDSNPNRSFDLHKVENGKIVCRSVKELQESTFINWEYNWQPKIEESEVKPWPPTEEELKKLGLN